MKKFIITAGIVFVSVAGYCQLSAKDKLALQIPEQETYSTAGISSYIKNNFASDSDRVRALFVWVANNINYDVDKVKYKRQGKVPVEEVLKTRKGVCQGYAELMVEVCKDLNVKATLVSGYTKHPNGSINDLSHAWVAAGLNNKWYLFDPTWAAGTVNDFQFIRRFSNLYYKLSPEEMIRDHMPFDPMYQFVDHPLMYNDFNRGNIAINTSRPYFNYADTISTYNRLDSLSQFVSFARRINRNGEKNQMIMDVLAVLNKNQNIGESKLGYEGAVARFREATALFNKYIDHKNQRFAAIKEDKEIQQMIDGVLEHFNAAKVMLEPVVPDNEQQKKALTNFNTNFYNFHRRVDEEKIFLKTYLKTGRSSRR